MKTYISPAAPMSGTVIAAIPASITTTPIRTRPPRTIAAIGLLARLGRRLVRHHDHGRAVRDDLGHRLGQLAAVEPHRDDGVATHERRVLHHPVDRLATGVLEQLGVLVDLTADQR